MDAGFFTQFNGGQMFKLICGANKDYFDKHDPHRLAEENANVLREKTIVRIMVGDADTMGNQVEGYACYPANKAFHEHLDRLKIPHQSIEVPGVGHQYAGLFSRTGDRALEFYRNAFARIVAASTSP